MLQERSLCISKQREEFLTAFDRRDRRPPKDLPLYALPGNEGWHWESAPEGRGHEKATAHAQVCACVWEYVCVSMCVCVGMHVRVCATTLAKTGKENGDVMIMIGFYRRFEIRQQGRHARGGLGSRVTSPAASMVVAMRTARCSAQTEKAGRPAGRAALRFERK